MGARLNLECSQRGFVWCPKDPSPLVERSEELGGCELLRVIACPVVLGFLKPVTVVQCANGQRLYPQLSDYSNATELREYTAEQLGLATEDIVLETAGGALLPEPPQVLARGTSVLCAKSATGGKESLAAAEELLKKTDAAEAAAAAKLDAEAAARAAQTADEH